MSANVKVNEIDGEHVLRDVMNIVTTYADYESLTNISKVCKSWRDEALREIVTRFYIQQVRLPYKLIGNRDSILGLNPGVSILFYKRDSDTLYVECEKQKLLEESLKDLPHKAIALMFEDYLTTEDIECNTTQEHCQLELEDNCDILDIFFPSVERCRANVNVAFMSPLTSPYTDERYEDAVNDLAQGLGLNDCKYPKSPIILCFSRGPLSVPGGEGTVRRFIERFLNREIMLFTSFKIVSVNCQNENRRVSREALVALRISGPNVASWSTFIPNYSQIDDIERKLQELKEKLTPGRKYTGLLFGHHCKQYRCRHVEHPAVDKQMVMRILRRFFPSVPFVGSFDGGCWNYDQQSRVNLESSSGLRSQLNIFGRMVRYTSIMIISYY